MIVSVFEFTAPHTSFPVLTDELNGVASLSIQKRSTLVLPVFPAWSWNVIVPVQFPVKVRFFPVVNVSQAIVNPEIGAGVLSEMILMASLPVRVRITLFCVHVPEEGTYAEVRIVGVFLSMFKIDVTNILVFQALSRVMISPVQFPVKITVFNNVNVSDPVAKEVGAMVTPLN